MHGRMKVIDLSAPPLNYSQSPHFKRTLNQNLNYLHKTGQIFVSNRWLCVSQSLTLSELFQSIESFKFVLLHISCQINKCFSPLKHIFVYFPRNEKSDFSAKLQKMFTIPKITIKFEEETSMKFSKYKENI